MSTQPSYDQPRHPIRVVAHRTGLTPDALRVWERRYRVVEPGRSPAGQRLYSDADIDRLGLMVRAMATGRSVGSVAGLASAELERLIQEDGLRERPRPAAQYLEQAWNAVRDLEPERLLATLRAAILTLGGPVAVDQVVAPLLSRIGVEWAERGLGIGHEHAASVMIKRAMSWLSEGADPAEDAPVLVVATPAGERHELGALLAATVGTQAGWRVTYLGPDLPAAEIADVAHRKSASLVALSVIAPKDRSGAAREIAALRKALDRRVSLAVGGTGASALATIPQGVDLIETLPQWRSRLGSFGQRKGRSGGARV